MIGKWPGFRNIGHRNIPEDLLNFSQPGKTRAIALSEDFPAYRSPDRGFLLNRFSVNLCPEIVSVSIQSLIKEPFGFFLLDQSE